MSLFGTKLRRGNGTIVFWCPGCNASHVVTLKS